MGVAWVKKKGTALQLEGNSTCKGPVQGGTGEVKGQRRPARWSPVTWGEVSLPDEAGKVPKGWAVQGPKAVMKTLVYPAQVCAQKSLHQPLRDGK